MKKIYICANIVLLVVICAAAEYHLKFKAPEPDKTLSRTPEPIAEVKKNTVRPEPVTVNVEDIVSNNPFHPRRGKNIEEQAPSAAPPPPPPGRQPQFELTGICVMGNITGAIIINKGANRHGGNPSGQSQRRFFKLNDVVADGYKLVAVTQNSATLQGLAEKIELKIEHKRFELESKSTPAVSQPPAFAPQPVPAAAAVRTQPAPKPVHNVTVSRQTNRRQVE
ncbi:MAG: hypothetical protein JXR78_13820 [Victivallales bacterium]|nr:hypothetical protein [Victivallales bacterium]